MKNSLKAPEIHVHIDLLENNPAVKKVIFLDEGYVQVYYDHPVLGVVLEVYANEFENILTLKAIYPQDMQEVEDIEICKDYYNNFCLGGHETYLDYYREDTGWYLLTTNNLEGISLTP